MQITISQWKQWLIEMFKARAYIVPCAMSSPGIGKTQVLYEVRDWVRQNTDFKDCKVVEIITSQILPNEVSGITMPNGRSHSMEVYDHKRLSSLKDGDILFFDELLQGSPQVLSACLTLIQERRMMSGRMLPDVFIVAAANPTASPNMIPEAVRQRFMFFNVKFDQGIWAKWVSDTFDIFPDSKLLDYVTKEVSEKKNQEWNKLTPRSATKLIQLYLESSMGDFIFKDYCEALYDDRNIGEYIIDSCKRNSFNRRVVHTIDGLLKGEELECWKNDPDRYFMLTCPERKIKDFIEYLGNSEVIIEALKNIPYNEDILF